LFIRIVALSAVCAVFSGCGKTETMPSNEAALFNMSNLRKKDEPEPEPEPQGSQEDIACQMALRKVAKGKNETFCKNNNGDKVCQWLYVDASGDVLFDQRVDENVDKPSATRP